MRTGTAHVIFVLAYGTGQTGQSKSCGKTSVHPLLHTDCECINSTCTVVKKRPNQKSCGKTSMHPLFLRCTLVITGIIVIGHAISINTCTVVLINIVLYPDNIY